jgi:hypothetical protein
VIAANVGSNAMLEMSSGNRRWLTQLASLLARTTTGA